MKLEFLYQPVNDLKQALAFYRDALGWEEAWREGEKTCSLQMPGSEVMMMIDEVATPEYRPGPIIVVDDVNGFYKSRNEDLRFWLEPEAIPGGYWAGFEDPFGNAVYILDQAETS